jgi:imidazolonepropionase-like amidohydrolase
VHTLISAKAVFDCTDFLVTTAELKLLVPGISDSDLEILKTYLARQGFAARDGDLLKFKKDRKARTPVITATDHGIVTLGKTAEMLRSQIAQLMARVYPYLIG